MTIETLQQAKKLEEEIRNFKAKKERLESIHADDLYIGNQTTYYILLPQEICVKIKSLVLDSLQENINRKTKQLEKL